MNIDFEEKAKENNALLREIQNKVRRSLKHSDKYHKAYKKNRKLVLAQDKENKRENPRRVYPFSIFSTLSALIPTLYAKNPEIEVRPDAIVMRQDEMAQWGEFAKSCEALLQKEFVDNSNLKHAMKTALRSTLTCGVGWLKVSLQMDYKQDAIIENRQNDAQDNIARLQYLANKDDSKTDSELNNQELSLQTEHVERTLRGEAELFTRKGIVVDVIAPENLFILDSNDNQNMSDYTQCYLIAQRVWMSVDEYESLFGHEAPSTTLLYANRLDDENTNIHAQEEVERKDKQVQVFEVWDRRSETVFTFALGANKWAREPYSPTVGTDRFFPFFNLIFNEVDGVFHPLSDVEMLEDYQKEYAQMRTDLNMIRRWNKPKYVVSKQGDLSANDANRLIQTVREDDTADWIAISSNPTQPIAGQMQQVQPPMFNQGLFDPSMIFRDIEMSTRTGDAARGFINKAKTATEAEIMSMGQQSGVSEKQDIIEDVMSEMATHALQLIAQSYTPEDVAEVIGTQAFWQAIPIDTLFKFLNLEIKAGSMSKPNKFQEREQWLQLMPVIRETMQMMAQLQQQGMMSMAECLKKLLQESINRFDERINLDEFLPDFQQDMQQQMMMQQMQQAQQMQQQPQGVATNEY